MENRKRVATIAYPVAPEPFPLVNVAFVFFILKHFTSGACNTLKKILTIYTGPGMIKKITVWIVSNGTQVNETHSLSEKQESLHYANPY